MATCVNIIVNIYNADTAVTQSYKGFVRPKGSIVDFSTYPQYTKTFTGNQVIFDGLPAGIDYEVAIVKICGNEQSAIIWKDAINESCKIPIVTFDTGDNKFTLDLQGATSYEYTMDELSWTRVDTAGPDPVELLMTAINTAYDNYQADRLAAVINFQFRSVCGAGSKSAITSYPLQDTAGTLTKITKIKDICEGSKFIGMQLRVSMSTVSTGSEELQYYSDAGTNVLVDYDRTGDNEADILFYKNFLNGFNIIRVLDYGTDPGQTTAISFDFISKVSPLEDNVPGDIPCANYDVKYEVVVAA